MNLLKDIAAIVGLSVSIFAVIACVESYTGPDPMFVQGIDW